MDDFLIQDLNQWLERPEGNAFFEAGINESIQWWYRHHKPMTVRILQTFLEHGGEEHEVPRLRALIHRNALEVPEE